MSRVEWGVPGERLFETGVDRGVLYPPALPGVPWNGLVTVTESNSGAELEPLYFDGVKYMDLPAAEDFEASLEAFSAPPEFDACQGYKQLSPGLFATNQPPKTFGLCYRTRIGNDLVGEEYGYKLHLVYNITASSSDRANTTIAGALSPDRRSWQLSTVPMPATTFRPTAHLVVDSTKVDPYLMEDLETVLYGRDATESSTALTPRLPTVEQIMLILSNPITEFIEPFI